LPLLWRTIAAYVAEHDIDLMFGCASLRGTDPVAVPSNSPGCTTTAWRRRTCAHGHARDHATPMDRLPTGSYDAARAFRALENRSSRVTCGAGAFVGEGAWVDARFQLDRRVHRDADRAPVGALCTALRARPGAGRRGAR
jgi:hypothetical protein